MGIPGLKNALYSIPTIKIVRNKDKEQIKEFCFLLSIEEENKHRMKLVELLEHMAKDKTCFLLGQRASQGFNTYRTVEVEKPKKWKQADRYLNHESKEVKMDYFFPNLGIEMLKVETNFEIQIYASFDKEKVLCKVVNETKKKIEYSISILSELIKRAEGKNQDLRSNDLSKIGNLISQKDRYDNCNISKENIKDLKKVVSQLSKLKDKKIIFLGGYKGLAHSIMNKRSTKDIGESNLDGYEGAFYIDNEETYLPFGLVKVL